MPSDQTSTAVPPAAAGRASSACTAAAAAAGPTRIKAGGGSSVLSWATDLHANALAQARTTARSPVVSGHLALMPDAHLGIGATIGSVIPTEAGIIPAAVGVDLGCGMTALRTGHSASHLPDDLSAALGAVAAAVPAGRSSHAEASTGARAWLRKSPLPNKKAVPNKAKQKMGAQLGTLGGGNHFIEVSLDEFDRVWVVLHSGSRGIGNKLATLHIRAAKRACQRAGRTLEDPDLAYFKETDEGFGAYVADMLWAQNYARMNRRMLADAVLRALRAATGLRFEPAERIDCHHNYAEFETHGGRQVWVTRKGAIRARRGDRGVIPGSMGDDTYIVSGKGCVASYCSSAHGAGRTMSRRQARQQITEAQLESAMSGRTWLSAKASRLLDEAPAAYRDIRSVMAAQSDLVNVQHRLKAVLNYKGC